MANSDDDALAWAGDEPARVDPVETRIVEVAAGPGAKRQIPAPVLITYGILAGAYLLYAVGWLLSVQRLNGIRGPLAMLNEIMFQFGEFLAIASPLLWFGAAFVLTRGRKPVARLLLLLAGLVVVLPWPFVLGAWT